MSFLREVSAQQLLVLCHAAVSDRGYLEGWFQE
jgi:hypothetical protein